MKLWLLISALVIFLLNPTSASAHSFGKLYNLPVPFWMYLYAAASALLLSFLVIGYFSNKTSTHSTDYSKIIKVKSNRISKILKALSVFLFLFTILTGLLGVDFSYLNFNMAFFWIIFVLGLTYLSALIGNIYYILNPWKILVELVEKFWNEKFVGVIKYPPSWGYLPALLLYFVFIWIELFGFTTPSTLSKILIQYSILNFLGVFLIGKENWFKYGEFFSVFFAMVGKIAPMEIIYSKNNAIESIKLSPPFRGLLKTDLGHLTLLLFILFMLSSTAYDGIKETVFWYQISWANIRDIFPLDSRALYFKLTQSLALFLSPFVFFIIYLIFIYLMKLVTKSQLSLKSLLLQFGYSLIPIAFVYNFAHYYTLILTEGQNFIRLLSDPFGFGWNLFGTTSYYSDLSLIDAGLTWHIQVAVILLGHIVSVYLAHVIALNLFKNSRLALISQIPMLVLMVTYTLVGLWILSQPLTGGTL